jgi:hypothetical protein
MNKELRNVSVHSVDLAVMNSEYNNTGVATDNSFICYTNQRIHKIIEINHTNPINENITFELYDLGMKPIPKIKIKLLRIELILNIIPD